LTHDLVIRNGTIVDGSGAEPWTGDVVIDSGRIVAVEADSGATAHEVIDADGRFVAPGFVDPHTHVDPQLWWDPFGLPLVLHGVTSVMTGNCSVTLAPCDESDRDTLARLFYQVEEVPLETLQAAVPWSWATFGEYLDGMEGNLGINAATLVGHSAVRYAVMGDASLERVATADEVDRMREVVRASIRAGAIGFSTSQNKLHVGEGGVPIPSRWADEAEILALCAVLGEEGRGIIQTDGGVDVARRAAWVREVGGPLAERTGRTVLAGNVLPAFPGSQEILDEIAGFQARGGSIYAQAAPSRFDSYFTLDGGTITFNVFPSWRRIGSMTHLERLEAFADPAMRDAIQYESVEGETPARWKHIRVAKVINDRNAAFEGRTVAELAAERGVRVVDLIADLGLDEDLQTQFVIEANPAIDGAIADFLRSPQALVGGSDAGAHVKTFCGGGNTSLMLSKWVRELGVLTVEEAVKRMTSEPAAALGLTGRGRLAPGFAADVVVFDLDRITYDTPRMVRDLPGGAERLWHDATGIDDVVVNGHAAVRDGEVTGALGGAVLRSTPAPAQADGR
jgi:N-acyl-D-aspartate/D-glutamate deacylase